MIATLLLLGTVAATGALILATFFSLATRKWANARRFGLAAIGAVATLFSKDGYDWKRVPNVDGPLTAAYGGGAYVGSGLSPMAIATHVNCADLCSLLE